MEKEQKKSNYIITLILLIIGCGMFLYGLNILYQRSKCLEVNGVFTRNKYVDSDEGAGSYIYYYDYYVDGVKYVFESKGHSSWHPKSLKATILYNADNPSKAYLKSAKWHYALLSIGLIFIIVAIKIFFAERDSKYIPYGNGYLVTGETRRVPYWVAMITFLIVILSMLFLKKELSWIELFLIIFLSILTLFIAALLIRSYLIRDPDIDKTVEKILNRVPENVKKEMSEIVNNASNHMPKAEALYKIGAGIFITYLTTSNMIIPAITHSKAIDGFIIFWCMGVFGISIIPIIIGVVELIKANKH